MYSKTETYIYIYIYKYKLNKQFLRPFPEHIAVSCDYTESYPL